MAASYERLADAAFAAAMDIQRYTSGKDSSFQGYRDFVRLLEEPVLPNETYKLLYDARNLPLYKEAWSNVFGEAATEVKAEIFLKRVSDFLRGTLQSIEGTGKSNLGRRGLVIETAAGVHPHFNGCLTLEMTNLGEIPLKIRPGMKICQLFIHETGHCPEPERKQFSAQIKPTFGRNA